MVLALAFAAVVWRLVDVQALSAARFGDLGLEQRVRRVTLAPERGAVFDRDGHELGLSVPAQTVWADPRAVTDPAGHARRLAPVLEVEEATLLERLSKPGAAFVYLQRKVDDETAARVRDLALPGVYFVPESKRHYPANTLAAPVLGLVGIDNEGLGGLELQYEELMAGRPGELVVERDPQGRDIPSGQRQYRPPAPGQDLILTIDQALQFEAERALSRAVAEHGARGGLAIVMDVSTGDVLAMANVQAWADGGAGPEPNTARNRAVTDVFEPGSTNKVVTVAAALEEGLVTSETAFAVPDRLALADHVFTDHKPHPTEQWTVREILTRSSNVGTILIGQRVGRERLDAYLRAFGFGRETGLGFPGESAGLLLAPEDWYPTSMGTVPIGNGLAVTALQMLDVYAAIGNDGMRPQPRLVEAVVDERGRRHDLDPGPQQRVVSGQTARLLLDMLRDAVTDGTGTRAAIPGYAVAGKTGTARKPLENARGYSDRHVASFVGLAPAENPRLAAIVVLDEPTPMYGGVVAAPVFAHLMHRALRLEGVPPGPETTG